MLQFQPISFGQRQDSLLNRLDAHISTLTHRPGDPSFTRLATRRNPAKLNFGDCFVYALAKTTAQPILFKGDDFSQTDIPRLY